MLVGPEGKKKSSVWTHPDCTVGVKAVLSFGTRWVNLDFGDASFLLLLLLRRLRRLPLVLLVHAQVQPQVVQSLTDGQSLLPPIGGLHTEARGLV